MQDIMEYLSVEWETNPIIDKSKVVFLFDSLEMTVVVPDCPQQPDLTSCGLYMIEFLGRVLGNVHRFSSLESYSDIQNWTNAKDMQFKRCELAELIRKISKEQSQNVKFPEISSVSRVEMSSGSQTAKPSSQEEEDLKFYNLYLQSAAEKEADLSLCRKYKLQLNLPIEKYQQMVRILNLLQHELYEDKIAHCVEVADFKEYLMKHNCSHAESDIRCCLNTMQEKGILRTKGGIIYFL